MRGRVGDTIRGMFYAVVDVERNTRQTARDWGMGAFSVVFEMFCNCLILLYDMSGGCVQQIVQIRLAFIHESYFS